MLPKTAEYALRTVACLAADPEQAASASNLYGHMSQMLNRTLDETERKVFTLHFACDMPLEAIGRLLKLENASGAKASQMVASHRTSRHSERR